MPRIEDLHQLPKVRDALAFVYVERCRVDQHEQSIAAYDETGMTPIPIASTAVLLLGPGTRVTHAAMVAIADNNALAIWVGEGCVRCYGLGLGGTRSAALLIQQAALVSDESSRLEVVRRLYRMRFKEHMDEGLTVEQLRGVEGARVRNTYARVGQEVGIWWPGRNYDRGNWLKATPANRALSAANSCLYGICHAAILAVGASPGLGFIHTGKQLSFVYDIADLYKTELTIPLAFRAAREAMDESGDEEPSGNLERTVRLRCRDAFREGKLLSRIVPDIKQVLGDATPDETDFGADSDPARPTELWLPASERKAREAEAPGEEEDDEEVSV